MVKHTTQYEYGGEFHDGGLDDDDTYTDAEPVIVDGSVMSYRSYRSGGGG